MTDTDDQARYLAHAQADREFQTANPNHNPWHPTEADTTAHRAYVNTRVPEILSQNKVNQ